jgi:hypothetical protein
MAAAPRPPGWVDLSKMAQGPQEANRRLPGFGHGGLSGAVQKASANQVRKMGVQKPGEIVLICSDKA